jgi:hypothetical protein
LQRTGFRPAAVQRFERTDSVEANNGSLEGRVKRVVFLGDRVEYHLETLVGPLYAVDSDFDKLVPQGSAVGIMFRLSGVSLLPPSSPEPQSPVRGTAGPDAGV